MPDDLILADNPVAEEGTTTEGPATPQIEPTAEPTAPQEPQPTETQAFSRRLKEKEAEIAQKFAAEMDALVADIYGGQYKTAAEVREALAQQKMQQEAEAKGIDPAIYEQMTAAERKAAQAEQTAQQAMHELNSYRRREELAVAAEVMAKDPRWGSFFTENREQIMKTASEMDGSNMSPQQHLEVARMFVFNDTWQPPDVAKIKQDAVKEYLAELKKQNVPVEGRGGGTPATPPASSDPWKRARATADSLWRGEKL